VRVDSLGDLRSAYARVVRDMGRARVVAGALVEGEEEDDDAAAAGPLEGDGTPEGDAAAFVRDDQAERDQKRGAAAGSWIDVDLMLEEVRGRRRAWRGALALRFAVWPRRWLPLACPHLALFLLAPSCPHPTVPRGPRGGLRPRGVRRQGGVRRRDRQLAHPGCAPRDPDSLVPSTAPAWPDHPPLRRTPPPTRPHPPEPYFNETGSNCPSLLPRRAQRDLLDLSARSVAALGLRDGVFHVEAKATPGGPRLIEVNCRMGGGCVRCAAAAGRRAGGRVGGRAGEAAVINQPALQCQSRRPGCSLQH
jgi:hypothetical protein